MSVYDYNRIHTDVTAGFASEAAATLNHSLARIEHCLRQLSNDQVWWRPRPEMNSIGNLILHLCGNIGQWVIAPLENVPAHRNRPAEFARRDPVAKEELQAQLRASVERAARDIAQIVSPAQILQNKHIQGYDTTMLTAIFHGVTHFEGHAQEIISMTRQLLGEQYVFLWTPKSPEQISATS